WSWCGSGGGLIMSRYFAAFFAAALIAFSLPAVAASGDAWDEFRAEVETACRAATEASFEGAAVVGDPVGADIDGAAVPTGLWRGGASGVLRLACVVDKVSRVVESGAPLAFPAP